MEKQKEYKLRYLLAKVVLHEEKRQIGSDSGRTNATKPCQTSSDDGAELENHIVGGGPM
jgi:hypothetical protein